MSTILRDIALPDLPQMQSIAAHYIANTAINLRQDVPEIQELAILHAQCDARKLPFFGVFNDGGMLGYCYLGQFRPKTGYRFSHEVSIYLHPNHCRKGLGTQMMQHLITLATQHPEVNELVAIITDGMDSGSIQLHEKFAFRMVGRLQNIGKKFDQFYDIVLMQRTVTS